MFWSKNKKNKQTPAFSVLLYKMGFKGVNISRTRFLDDFHVFEKLFTYNCQRLEVSGGRVLFDKT